MKVVQILLIEDDPGDVRLTREALRDARMPHLLHVVRDGEEALSYLRRRGPYHHAAVPNIILLDLNLPSKDGQEVLKTIKEDDGLKHIPVIILSTSSNTDDINRSYAHHANCYIVKPDDFDAYIDAVQTIERFWFAIAELPR